MPSYTSPTFTDADSDEEQEEDNCPSNENSLDIDTPATDCNNDIHSPNTSLSANSSSYCFYNPSSESSSDDESESLPNEEISGVSEGESSASEQDIISTSTGDESITNEHTEPESSSMELDKQQEGVEQTQRRGRGRGRGHGRGRGRGQRGRRGFQHPPPFASLQLPHSAQDISTVDAEFKEPPQFQPLRTPGPHIPPNTEISASGLFNLYYDDALLERLVKSTNEYAEENKNKKKSMYKRFKYHALDKHEIMRFITVLLLLGITEVRSYRKAWNTKNAQVILRLNELMSRNRFEAIGAFFHIVTPGEERANSRHPLRKILPLHELMKEKCRQFYQPLQQLSVDERMVRSKA